MQREKTLQLVKPNETIRRPALLSLLRKEYPRAKLNTLDWHIHTLLEQGKLVRQGRGAYAVSSNKSVLSSFTPTLPQELFEIGQRLGRKFPLVTTCVWTTSILHSFVVQQPTITYWLVEAERDEVDVIFDFILNDVFINRLSIPIIRADDLALMERYTPGRHNILLVKPLISEAPLLQNDQELNVPTLEKVIVDLVADNNIFGLFLAELPSLLVDLTHRFLLNQGRLRRYARRRHKLSLVDSYLPQRPTDCHS
ncbi:DUF6577 family protein [Dyadobacter chenhuakuii]|uniref:Transcriptional regulator of viral defense system n=1 Tax=Dyadobacter chenhuakuii TaxID=2909339 RepID=A0ABY4XM17_9BACT|nr:DUF6577 family protein [Dyadobacter chenhuakuii]MCF2494282.1 hypothetical protein [Dyadobacter chenhuakuii]USJ31407.1 hypothetical protein NFI80_01435 [Dyadobacter chenhuakuii]